MTKRWVLLVAALTLIVAACCRGGGMSNAMVTSVLERRAEIGLRRALGATKRHVASQFLGEALLLAAVGGIGGVG